MIDATSIGLPDARLFYAMAREHVDDPALWDDCVQEAAIHVWRLQQRGGNHSPAYYRLAARRRIKEVATRQTWTGHGGKNGKAIDPLRRPHDSLDQMYESTSNQEAKL